MSGIPLLDVNLLVALAWPNHVHHRAAHAWFGSVHERGWATCSITESGFVRVSSNPRATPEAKRPIEALHLLRALREVSGHVFWSDDVSLAADSSVRLDRLAGHRQVTDQHLLCVALSHKGVLATFDRGVLDLVPESIRPDDALVLLEA